MPDFLSIERPTRNLNSFPISYSRKETCLTSNLLELRNLHVHQTALCPRCALSIARSVHAPLCQSPALSTIRSVSRPVCPRPEVFTARLVRALDTWDREHSGLTSLLEMPQSLIQLEQILRKTNKQIKNARS